MTGRMTRRLRLQRGTHLCICAGIARLCSKLGQARGASFVPAAAKAIKTVRAPHSLLAVGSGSVGSAVLLQSAAIAASSLPPAPSGVNLLPEVAQAAIVVAIFGALAALTTLLVGPGFRFLRDTLPEGWFSNWQKTWPVVGGFYVAAGVAHFTAADAFESIYPPAGTWGVWYLPGSASFHVAWTGVAEIAGGAGLFFGSLLLLLASLTGTSPPLALRWIVAASALGLFGLTWAVTPANVYMYTHGAQMVGLTPGDVPIPVEFHAIRGAVQVLLFSILWGCYEEAKPAAEE
mmetsp:Transcript_26367/g.48162  ORF Transcript_26367/g.48162 Transcript_26367/m.48162 type:complete len:290 (+) Transcript_26367:37-906(+)